MGNKEKAFRRWASRFYEEFKVAGFDDADFFMQGSAASGVRYSDNVAINARLGRKPNDYDVAIVSPKLLQRADELGIDVLRRELSVTHIQLLGLSDAKDILSKASKGGIKVKFKIYLSIEDVFNYGKTIPFSLWRN